MRRAYVLLSGGIDSTTCLYIADQEFKGAIVGVSIDYGQRHKKEIEFARRACDKLLIQHHVITLPNVIPPTSMLLNTKQEIPNISYDEIKGISPTYVPFRNGLMLSALTALAQAEFQNIKIAEKEWAIYFGAHAEDAANWAYPDCTPEFIGAMANAIYIGSYSTIRLHTPLQWLTKQEIVRKGELLRIDWSMTWSCYAGGAVHCGVCPTCRARKTAFIKASVVDPTRYAA